MSKLTLFYSGSNKRSLPWVNISYSAFVKDAAEATGCVLGGTSPPEPRNLSRKEKQQQLKEFGWCQAIHLHYQIMI